MGVALAQRFDGEVVSVDSMQIYRGMAVGTAAPTPEEMEGVPHHMIGVADPWENWSVARFTQAADACVQDILRRGKRPVLVGGTGLYLDALLRGIDFAAGSQDTPLRRQLQEQLRRGGPRRRCWRSCGASTRTAPHGCTCGTKSASCGRWRSIRRQGETITQHDRRTQAQPPRYEGVFIGLSFRDRQDLRDRIDRRVDDMVAQGCWTRCDRCCEAGCPAPPPPGRPSATSSFWRWPTGV